MRNRLRLYSGLVLFVFVTGHFLNHSLGLISLDMMNRGSQYFLSPWQTGPGSILLYGSGIIHAGVALYSLWQRRTLRMPAWEATQLIAGMIAPLFLAAHVIGTRGLTEVMGFSPNYGTTLNVLWNAVPWRGVVHAIAVCIIWTHSCVGLHFWLRIYPLYQRFSHIAFSFALIIPTLALAGYVSAGIEVQTLAKDPVWVEYLLRYSYFEPNMTVFAMAMETRVQIMVIAMVTLILLARVGRERLRRLRRRPQLYYSPDNRVIELQREATLLESIRRAGIPHASVCGGRGRCSTCRVRISEGLDQLAPPDAAEKQVLSRITESPSVRLACQIRPSRDIKVSALVRANAEPKDAGKPPGYRQGSELTVAFMFVDLRGSTKLSEERLPFDVVFILNQFFAELSLALKETNGHYAQFNGDGLLAIYGLQSGTEQGCREAFDGARAMFQRLDELNDRLREELGHDLEIGIGIHAGEAIVGSMGPPQTPIVSALGDNVNIAARLEAQTKELGAPLVVSARTAAYAGVDLSAFPLHNIHVKGRDQPLDVYGVDDMSGVIMPAVKKIDT
jgi:adenylate cyclase